MVALPIGDERFKRGIGMRRHHHLQFHEVIALRVALHAFAAQPENTPGVRMLRDFQADGACDGVHLNGASVQGFVQSAGGSIEVESTPGEGSRFLIILPAEPPLARSKGTAA